MTQVLKSPITKAHQELFPPQQDLLNQGYLDSRDNWLVCTPTGSGKTLMAEWAMHQAIGEGRRGVYIAPLKAIVEERLDDWQKRFPGWEIGLYTGEVSRSPKHRCPGDEQILLFTPEKLLAYLQSWKRHLPWLSQIGVLVIDEFHLIGDPHRGPGVESLVNRLTRVNPFVRVVGLSGTLENREEMAQWFGARIFFSDWRPIELERRFVRFKKVGEKRELLLSEILPVLEQGGKVLVFVNSRKRSESLTTWLLEQEIDAAFNHAGLSREARNAIQQRLRNGDIDVVVSTSSLEMGVNFPARKVIIFDSYGFDGERFGPIPVERYLQMAGRAGRPGFDERGEAVLFLPQWAGNEPDYEKARLNPTRSGLFRRNALLREILCEVAGRLSISETHLQTNFADRSLWRAQGGKDELADEIQLLLETGLLRAKEPERYFLSETALGRIASQMSVSPETVIFLGEFFHSFPRVTEFDIMLAACLCPETTPKLGFNFEEIDALAETVLDVSSEMLNVESDHVLGLSPYLTPRTLLSGLKCAAILHQYTQGKRLEDLAETYDAYPIDIEMLKRNVGWLLSVAQRVFSCHWAKQLEEEGLLSDEEEGETEPSPRPKCTHEVLCRNLIIMTDYGVPSSAIGLAQIDGVGPKRAQLLVSRGILSPAELLKVDPEELGDWLRLKGPAIDKIRESARKILAAEAEEDPFAIEVDGDSLGTPEPCLSALSESTWPPGIDPYRLRRALELTVDSLSEEVARVSGGSEPHRIDIIRDARGRSSYSCDCMDFAKGHSQCKHVLRTRLERRDDADLIPLLRLLARSDSRPLRYAMGDLWMKVGGLYDAFHGREVDYSGKRFLDRALAIQR